MTALVLAVLMPLLTPRVAVVVSGPHAEECGRLQRELEGSLAGWSAIRPVGADAVAAGIGSTAPEPPLATPDAGTLKRASELISTASDAYYRDKPAEALDALSELTTLEEHTPGFPVNDRIRVHLWRAAVFLALSDPEKADGEAAAALTLDPALSIGLSEFPPSMVQSIARVRKDRLQTVSLEVKGLPADAAVTVDERNVSTRSALPSGEHLLVITAPRRRRLVLPLEVSGETTLDLSLPVALDPALQAAIGEVVQGGSAPPALREAVSRLGVDRVLVVQEGTPVRWALVAPHLWESARRGQAEPAKAAKDLPGWLAEAMRLPARGAPTLTVRPDLGVDGGIGWGFRSRQVTSSGGSFQAFLVGVGPQLAARAGVGHFGGELEGRFLDWQISTIRESLPGGGSQTVDGGSSARATLAAFWRSAGPSEEVKPVWRAGLHASWEKLSANDLTDGAGSPLGVLTGYTRVAVGLDGEGRISHPMAGVLTHAAAGLSVDPVSSWTENPAGGLGQNPVPGVGFGWFLGAGAFVRPGLDLTLRYEGSRETVSYSGTGTGPISPKLQDAQLTELQQVVSLTARYGF